MNQRKSLESIIPKSPVEPWAKEIDDAPQVPLGGLTWSHEVKNYFPSHSRYTFVIIPLYVASISGDKRNEAG